MEARWNTTLTWLTDLSIKSPKKKSKDIIRIERWWASFFRTNKKFNIKRRTRYFVAICGFGNFIIDILIWISFWLPLTGNENSYDFNSVGWSLELGRSLFVWVLFYFFGLKLIFVRKIVRCCISNFMLPSCSELWPNNINKWRPRANQNI